MDGQPIIAPACSQEAPWSSTDENRGNQASTKRMAELQLWCRVAFVDPEGTVVERIALWGTVAPDLGALEEVAHLQCRATRSGLRAVLSEVAPAMDELLELAGLALEVER